MPETPLELTTSLRDVSVTELGAWRTCRRRYHLEVIENLEPKQPSWALSFGTGMHTALELYYLAQSGLSDPRVDPDVDPIQLAKIGFDEWYSETYDEVMKNLGKLWTPEIGEEINELHTMGETMLEHYPTYEATSKTTFSEIVAIEGNGMNQFENKRPKGYPKEADVIVHPSGRCMVPIVNPHTKEPIEYNGGPVYLTARLDMLVHRPRPFTGLWVWDHKTARQQPSNRGLDFDEQTTGYCYVVWRLTGTAPRGAIFNYLIKNVPQEPRRLKNGELSSAKDQRTTPDQYREALIEDGLYKQGKVTSAKHAECLAALLSKGWDPYFQRFEPRRNLFELESFESRLVYQYQDMTDTFENEEKRYPNLSTWWCPTCSVAPICQAIEEGSDHEDVIEHRFQQSEDRKAV